MTYQAEFGGDPIVSDRCKLRIRHSDIRALGPNNGAIRVSGAAGTTPYYAVIEGTTISVVEGPAARASAFIIGANGGVQITNSVIRGGSQLYGTFNVATSAPAFSSFVRFSTLYNVVFNCGDASLPILSTQNNIIVNELATAQGDTVTGSRCTHSHNLIKPQSSAVNGPSNFLNLDPRFVDGAGGDYRLLVGSPAIDKADAAATESVDLAGTPRPQGSGRDLGAFEYKPM